ncbi:hypothetical protein GCM10009687_77310 [Asanoa iriomotensis]|uniref:Lipoprotein n=1 Tax=Asanoa iriomotensis TaxID=234613 RepID=A0ABQ4CE08_9ACTN|nr:hypothetical protein Air01nite_70980 [Asanoa iriomotensis]
MLVVSGLCGAMLVGCGQVDGPPPVVAEAGEQARGERYRANGIVLEDVTHGPQLCETATASLKPQCQGIDIVGWSWEQVAHQDIDGTRHGVFEVVGTFDGERLTLTEPPGPPRLDRHRQGPDFTSPCPPPAGGWRVVDHAKATDAALQKARALVDSAPAAAGAWIDQNGGENDPKKLVLNVRFTGDLAAHENRLRRVWGGALCVLPAARTTADLERVRSDVEASLPGVTATSIDVVENRVDVRVDVATDEDRRAADERYGPGAVGFTPFLKPL